MSASSRIHSSEIVGVLADDICVQLFLIGSFILPVLLFLLLFLSSMTFEDSLFKEDPLKGKEKEWEKYREKGKETDRAERERERGRERAGERETMRMRKAEKKFRKNTVKEKQLFV